MPRTDVASVHTILDLLTEAGVPVWIAGGWGVDALIGRPTRDHADLDVAIPAEAEAAALDALQGAGFEITTDWRPIRVALTRPDGAEADVHPLRFDADGSAIQHGFDGVEYEYPAADFTSGTIGGRPVACISARLQVEFHSGYEPGPTDRADMEALAGAVGITLPEAYR
jgi:lincosamide nucleotidyltransferase A/C/D/E